MNTLQLVILRLAGKSNPVASLRSVVWTFAARWQHQLLLPTEQCLTSNRFLLLVCFAAKIQIWNTCLTHTRLHF